MPLKFLIDEDSRSEALWNALDSLNGAGSGPPVDFVRVGDVGCPILGASDTEVIVWASNNERIIVSQDKRTLIREFYVLADSGIPTCGLFIIRPDARIQDIADYLFLAAHVMQESEIRQSHRFIPE